MVIGGSGGGASSTAGGRAGVVLLQLTMLQEEGLKPLLKLALEDGGQLLQQLPQAASFRVGGGQLPLQAAQGGGGEGWRGRARGSGLLADGDEAQRPSARREPVVRQGV